MSKYNSHMEKFEKFSDILRSNYTVVCLINQTTNTNCLNFILKNRLWVCANKLNTLRTVFEINENAKFMF